MQTARDTALHTGQAHHTLRQDPRLPWVVIPALILGTFLFEAVVHRLFFDAPTFTSALFSRSPHEWWMRILFSAPMIAAMLLWSSTIRERNERLAELASVQARLRAVNARLAHGEALDRGDLATRLHENVGQTLAAAGMYLSAVDTSQLTAEEGAALRSAGRTVTRVLADVRDIAQELQPAPLADFGLKPAIESLARRVMRRSGRSVEVALDECVDRIEPQAAVAVFQVLSELVESAACDERSSTVRIGTCASDHRCRIIVSWDSCGACDLLASDEWLRSVGGDVERLDEANTTTVVVTVPETAA